MTMRSVLPAAGLIQFFAVFPAQAESERPTRPPSTQEFIQYGAAFETQSVLTPGSVCPAAASVPCILRPGFGPTLRMGYRERSPWYFGGAYGFSRHETSNLLRLGILQSLRAEARYYADRGMRLTPYASGLVGVSGFGSEWHLLTAGPELGIGAGVEFQVTEKVVAGLAAGWHALGWRHFRDDTGQGRANGLWGFGVAHLATIALVLEIRDPLPRW